MMLDLVFIGVMVRLLFTVAQHGIARRDAAACSPLRLGRLPSGA